MAIYTNAAQAEVTKQYVWGTVEPYAGSTAPTHEDTDCKGGYQCVADATARNAIPVSKREYGMIVFQQNDETEYKLESNLTTWTSLIGTEQLTSSLYTHRRWSASSIYDMMEEYKWDDGTLELFIRFIGVLTATQTGTTGVRYANTPTLTYPTRFIATPKTAVGVHDTANGLAWGGINHVNTTSCSMIIHGSNSWSRGVGYLHLVGKWK